MTAHHPADRDPAFWSLAGAVFALLAAAALAMLAGTRVGEAPPSPPPEPRIEPSPVAALTYTPQIRTTGNPDPALGSGNVRWGQYVETPDGRCQGEALIRWGTGSISDGNGFFQVTLPEPADPNVYDQDPSNSEIVGTAVVGRGLTHTVATAHLSGFTGQMDRVLLAAHGGLFAGSDWPNGPLGNVHLAFDYSC